MYTPSEIINIAKAAQYLSADDIANGQLYGTRLTPNTSRILYMERVALEWLYNVDPTNSELQFIANYVLSLCRGDNLAAINITGGGSIAPTGGSSVRPDKLDFTVADSGSIMISGQSVLYIDGTNGLPDMRGFEIIFSRGALVQSINDVGGSYYTWNSYNGKFECFGSANLDEQFIIQPTI